jgi:hypothetical protein
LPWLPFVRSRRGGCWPPTNQQGKKNTDQGRLAYAARSGGPNTPQVCEITRELGGHCHQGGWCRAGDFWEQEIFCGVPVACKVPGNFMVLPLPCGHTRRTRFRVDGNPQAGGLQRSGQTYGLEARGSDLPASLRENCRPGEGDLVGDVLKERRARGGGRAPQLLAWLRRPCAARGNRRHRRPRVLPAAPSAFRPARTRVPSAASVPRDPARAA